MSEYPIPIDLAERYARLVIQAAGSRAQRTYARFQLSLIERIAKLTAEKAALSGPVTVAELKRNGVQGLAAIHAKDGVNKLLAARSGR